MGDRCPELTTLPAYRKTFSSKTLIVGSSSLLSLYRRRSALFGRHKLSQRQRHKLSDRLQDHAEIYLIASALYCDENVSNDFNQLAHACRQVAATLIRMESEAQVKPVGGVNSAQVS
jgi:hypothetical protein